MKFVDIKTGGLCNNRCVHCVVARQDRIGTRGTQSYKRSISAAVRNGATSISVTGGEPTLHEGIVAILSHAKAKGLSVTLQTNGRYLEKKEFARELEDLVDQYVIALHGSTPMVHDAITRRKGSFRQTVAGVKNISNGRARVVAKVVLTALNLTDLMKLADLILELQMDVAVFTFVHGVGEAWTTPEDRVYAITEIILSLVVYIGSMAYVRLSKSSN